MEREGRGHRFVGSWHIIAPVVTDDSQEDESSTGSGLLACSSAVWIMEMSSQNLSPLSCEIHVMCAPKDWQNELPGDFLIGDELC
jgi:hypothetical protein